MFLDNEILRFLLDLEKSSAPISVVVGIKKPAASENHSEKRAYFSRVLTYLGVD